MQKVVLSLLTLYEIIYKMRIRESESGFVNRIASDVYFVPGLLRSCPLRMEDDPQQTHPAILHWQLKQNT